MALERRISRAPRAARLLLVPVLAIVAAMSVAIVPPASAATVIITIRDQIDPRSVTVPPDTAIEFRNESADRHRMRSTEGPSRFDVDLEPGDRATVTLTAAGTYHYVDDRDRDLRQYWGEIVVKTPTAGDSTSPAPAGTTPADTVAAPGPPSSVAVSIGDRSFEPSSLVVAPGGTVTWTNTSGRDHTVTSTGGVFDSGDLGPGATFAFTFSTSGSYGYRCDLHPEMTGVVSVSSDGREAAPPPPAPDAAATPRPTAGASASPTATAAPAGAAGAATRRVDIVDFTYSPASVVAAVGDTVTWTNRGAAPHTVTAATFDSLRMAPGATFTTTLAAAGTVTYTCTIHPEMVGTIRVGTTAEPPPPVSPPTPSEPAGTSPVQDLSPDSDDATAHARAAPLRAGVEVADFRFTPRKVIVREGGTVTWTFVGDAPHTVTAAAFDSAMRDKGATFDHTFANVGTYSYTCTLHPQMRGTVEVVATTAAKRVVDGGELAAAAASTTRPSSTTSAERLLYGILGGAAIIAATGTLLLGTRRFLSAFSS